MLNDFIKEIIVQYSSSTSEGIIDWNLRTRLTETDFAIIQSAFDLSEQRLSYLDCTGDECYEEVEVKTKRDGSKYIQCRDCKKLDFIDKNQDLAHKITLDGLADFLIRLLEIEQNKKIIKFDEILHLGKKIFANIVFDVYLTKTEQGKKDSLEDLKLSAKKNRSFVIKLSNDLTDEEDSCWFCDLIYYDKKVKKFIPNNEFIDKLITSFKSEKSILDKRSIIADNNRKYAAGGKKKAEKNFGDAKEYILSEYKRLKSKNMSKKDIARLVARNFPPKTFPVMLSEETIYRYILSVGKADK